MPRFLPFPHESFRVAQHSAHHSKPSGFVLKDLRPVQESLPPKPKDLPQ